MTDQELTEYEKAMMGGIVLRPKREKSEAVVGKEKKKNHTAKKSTYIKGTHGSASAKMKADIQARKKSRKSQRKKEDK